jgi:PKD repeat protein
MDRTTIHSQTNKKIDIPFFAVLLLLLGFLLVMPVSAASGGSINITGNIVTTSMVVANFTENTTFGEAPLCVQFMDTSIGSPTTWNWSFGDGNYSSVQNPVHTYFIPGTYLVNLTAGDIYGSNLSATINITAGTPPIPSFTFTPPDPMVNTDTVTFDASGSWDPYGNITLYTWNFDDGSPLSYSNSTTMTHVFIQPKVCNVSLMVTDNQTFTNTTIVQVPVYAVKTTFSTQVNGTQSSIVNGNQTLDVNTSTLQSTGGALNSTSTTLTIQNVNPFWPSVQIFAQNVTLNQTIGNYTVQNVSQVIMQSAPITAALTPSVGTVSVSLDVALCQTLPNTAVNVSITQGATTSVIQGFQLAAHTTNISVAYTVQFSNTQQIDSSLTTNATQAPQAAVITMSVNHTWVALVANSTNNDGRDAIVIFRYPETGPPIPLATWFDHYDPATNLDYFKANSPNGLSIFGLVEYAAQQAAASQQSGTGSGSSSSGGGAGGGAQGGSMSVAGAPASQQPPGPAETLGGPPQAPQSPQSPSSRPAAQPSGATPLSTPTDPFDIVVSLVLSAVGLLRQNLILATVSVVLVCVVPVSVWWYYRKVAYDRVFKK